MRILVAPDSFKGSLSAVEAAEAVADGFARVFPRATMDLLPVADGGEGTVDAMVTASGGRKRTVTVTGPLSEPVDAALGLLDDGRSVVIEAAAACGLTRIPPDRRDPRVTTTRGVGEMLLAALDARPERIVIGIGGSATNDAGAGMLRALGLRLADANGRDLPEGGAVLAIVETIDRSGWRWPEPGPEIVVASDVTNPLCGPLGASAVFGPQKGAGPETVDELDRALGRFAEVTRRALGRDLADTPGAGAAGGLGFALMAYLGAQLRPGIEIVLDASGFAERARRADLIVTGEGRLDSQTALGKAVAGVARAGRAANRPVVALAGSLEGDAEGWERMGLAAWSGLAEGPIEIDTLMTDARRLLANAAERQARWLCLGGMLTGD